MPNLKLVSFKRIPVILGDMMAFASDFPRWTLEFGKNLFKYREIKAIQEETQENVSPCSIVKSLIKPVFDLFIANICMDFHHMPNNGMASDLLYPLLSK